MTKKKVCHILKSSINNSSRVYSQKELDGGTFLDKSSLINFALLFTKPASNIYVFHQHAMLINLILFYFKCTFISIPKRPRIVFDVHDLNECKGPFLSKHFFHYIIHMSAEYVAFILPNITFMTVSKGLSRVLFKRYKKTVLVVPNLCKPVVFNNENKHCRKVIYFGQINERRIPISFIKNLNDIGFEVDLYGVFSGEGADQYKSTLRDLYPGSYKGSYNANNIQNIVSQYHFSLLYIKSNKVNIRFCLPNKLFQSLSVGVPCIISPELHEVNLTFRGKGVFTFPDLDLTKEKMKFNYRVYYDSFSSRYLRFLGQTT